MHFMQNLAETSHPVPHLKTALQGPLQEIEHIFLDNQVQIEAWFRCKWQKLPPPIYGSVDIRNAGFKLAPVDMNLFPAGFNNLNPDFLPLCIQAIQNSVEKCVGDIHRVLLIPESHTRNMFYLENVARLQEIISKAGFEVRIGSLLEDLSQPKELELPSGNKLLLEPIKRQADKIMVGDFIPCLIWLNNDLSNGIPEILQNIQQKIRPPVCLGWSKRLKSEHFQYYQQVVQEFADKFNFDSWLINPLFKYCYHVDFLSRDGMECLAEKASIILQSIQDKYDVYDIKEKPFVIVKADRGTYGMNVLSVTDPDQLLNLNRKIRGHMAVRKGGQKVTQIILQEGVYTFETLAEGAVAEPVIYMIGNSVVGGFYRVHQKRGPRENLNAPGMHFEPLAFAKSCNNPDCTLKPDACQNRFYAYGVVGRLSMLAAAKEEQALESSDDN